MRATISKSLSAVLAFTVITAGSPAGAATEDRALWVWDGPSAEVIDLAIARGITDIYLHVPPGFSRDQSYASFIEEAHQSSALVHATGGDPSWAYDARAWSAWVDEVVSYGQFDGVVFDVEPHTLPEWNSKKRTRLVRSYLNALRRATLRAGTLRTLATVPFWWDQDAFRHRGRMLVEHVLARSDGIIVMAYRDHASGTDGIVEHTETEAVLAAGLGREFVVGVETGPAGLDKVSFFEEGATALETELSIVVDHYFGSPSFGGIAIHHFGSYVGMRP